MAANYTCDRCGKPAVARLTVQITNAPIAPGAGTTSFYQVDVCADCETIITTAQVNAVQSKAVTP